MSLPVPEVSTSTPTPAGYARLASVAESESIPYFKWYLYRHLARAAEQPVTWNLEDAPHQNHTVGAAALKRRAGTGGDLA